ncbi:PE-PPE domain-containing protein [Mycolicibacterium holsaticum]|uniref:PE-PPE domain-containing protein n=1 Tax=Mycolicibacterium holsaticum TaxID=152142 RepID=A0A1E3RWQ7_9MYCO|nr:PE-PPE domain-containing protein [Mycolicibacterium holsaticum]ODQ94284.1 PE-PPE domain-containing protein [Mycolicibacterium holsaticum]
MGTRARKLALGVAAAGIATSVAGVAALQPAAITAPIVDLAALIVVGSSTNPSGAGVENFFQGKFNDPMYTGPNGDDIVYVNFWSGAEGIERALDANAGERNAIIASGWGAANASLLALSNRPDLSDTVLILDNDVARPDGGFGTRYPWFALIGVNPFPTPSKVPALRAVNIGYEYDYNSNAPAVLLNPLAAVNSLVGYLYRHRDQASLHLPVNPDGTPAVACNANTCAITVSGAVLDCPDARCSSPGDRITAYITTRNNTTYVTYAADELPLTRLIGDIFGRRIAAFTDPLLRLLVDAAYYGGNPIPSDPSAYRPATLFPSLMRVLDTIVRIPGAIAQGWHAATAPPKSAPKPAATQDTSTADAAGEQASEQDSAEKTSLMQSPVVERALSSLAQFRQSPEADAQADPAAQADAQDVNLSQAPTDEKRAPRTNVVRTSVKAEPGGAGLTGGTEADTDSAAAEADSPAESMAESPQPTADDTDAAQTTGDEAGAEQDSAEPTSAAA